MPSTPSGEAGGGRGAHVGHDDRAHLQGGMGGDPRHDAHLVEVVAALDGLPQAGADLPGEVERVGLPADRDGLEVGGHGGHHHGRRDGRGEPRTQVDGRHAAQHSWAVAVQARTGRRHQGGGDEAVHRDARVAGGGAQPGGLLGIEDQAADLDAVLRGVAGAGGPVARGVEGEELDRVSARLLDAAQQVLLGLLGVGRGQQLTDGPGPLRLGDGDGRGLSRDGRDEFAVAVPERVHEGDGAVSVGDGVVDRHGQEVGVRPGGDEGRAAERSAHRERDVQFLDVRLVPALPADQARPLVLRKELQGVAPFRGDDAGAEGGVLGRERVERLRQYRGVDVPAQGAGEERPAPLGYIEVFHGTQRASHLAALPAVTARSAPARMAVLHIECGAPVTPHGEGRQRKAPILASP
ncbi:hypothetical protein GA0115236_10973 [Streptomyces sp. IgraMP-1]|nr:hypothetical protein GA0115236_10973 [Streptomyces sp. IgraMP-1]